MLVSFKTHTTIARAFIFTGCNMIRFTQRITAAICAVALTTCACKINFDNHARKTDLFTALTFGNRPFQSFNVDVFAQIIFPNCFEIINEFVVGEGRFY